MNWSVQTAAIFAQTPWHLLLVEFLVTYVIAGIMLFWFGLFADPAIKLMMSISKVESRSLPVQILLLPVLTAASLVFVAATFVGFVYLVASMSERRQF